MNWQRVEGIGSRLPVDKLSHLFRSRNPYGGTTFAEEESCAERWKSHRPVGQHRSLPHLR
jgi:hypothetical protein